MVLGWRSHLNVDELVTHRNVHSCADGANIHAVGLHDRSLARFDGLSPWIAAC